MTRFVPVDREQRMLLPIDLRDWIAEDDLAHFVIEAVERVPVSRFRVNERGSGSAQYHPQMMLALLVYCYAHGIFSSRRIEHATYRDVGVRYLAANRHPDHDTICKFRRENEKAVREAFLQVLLLAREVRLLRVGLVSVDGTQIDANASRHRNVRYDRAGELVDQLRGEISQLLERSERANGEEVSGSEGLPTELSRRKVLRERLEAARARLQARAQEQAERERPAYEAKVAAGRRRGPVPKAPSGTPCDKEQSKLTDPDSGLMRRSRSHESRQCYNAQAAVAAEGSQLVLGARIARNASDRNELVASVDAIPSALQLPETVLADNGYANGEEVAVLQGRGVEVLVATCAEGDRRQHDFRPEPAPRAARTMRSAWMLALRARLEQPELRAKYRLTDRGAGVRCAQTGDGVHAFPAAGVRRGRDRVATCNVGLQLPANPPIAGLGPSIETEKDNQRPRPCHPRTIDRRTYQPGRRDDARIRPTEHERLYSETAKSDRLLTQLKDRGLTFKATHETIRV